MSGTLALIGGKPFDDACTFNRSLIEAAGATEVVLLPTAAAFEQPDRAIATARAYLENLGVSVRVVRVLNREDANQADNAEAFSGAKVIYLIGSSAMHARPTLMNTAVWEAVVKAWNAGATVIGSDAGAQVLCDPMVDDRGGAFTVGLGLIDRIAVVARRNTWSEDALHRLRQMTNDDLAVIGIDESTVAIRSPDRTWTTQGTGRVLVHVGDDVIELAALNR